MIFARWQLGVTLFRPTFWASARSECLLASFVVKIDTFEVDTACSKDFASDIVSALGQIVDLWCIPAKVSGKVSPSMIRLQQRSDLCRFPGRSIPVSILHKC